MGSSPTRPTERIEWSPEPGRWLPREQDDQQCGDEQREQQRPEAAQAVAEEEEHPGRYPDPRISTLSARYAVRESTSVCGRSRLTVKSTQMSYSFRFWPWEQRRR